MGGWCERGGDEVKTNADADVAGAFAVTTVTSAATDAAAAAAKETSEEKKNTAATTSSGNSAKCNCCHPF